MAVTASASAVEQYCISQLLEKLRSFLFNDFTEVLKEHGQCTSVVDGFQKAAMDKTILEKFLFNLLPSEATSEVLEAEEKKKVLRDYAKVFDLPLGLRVILVNRCLSIVSDWQSWSVIDGGFRINSEEKSGAIGLQLSPKAIVLGTSLTSTCPEGNTVSVLNVFEVFSKSWSDTPLTLIVYDPKHEHESDAGGLTKKSLSLETFLLLSMQWLMCGEQQKQGGPCGVTKGYSLRYIRQSWCLVVASTVHQISLQPTNILTALMPSPFYSGVAATCTETLEDFLSRGLLRNSPSATVELIMAVCCCVSDWQSATESHDIDSTRDWCYSLHLSLQHFLVTYSSVTTLPTHDSSRSVDCTQVTIVKCELRPFVVSYHHSTTVPCDSIKTADSNMLLYLVPPELHPPVNCNMLRRSPSHGDDNCREDGHPSLVGVSGGDTTVGSDCDFESNLAMELDTEYSLGQQSGGMTSASSLYPSPASTLSSSQPSPDSKLLRLTVPLSHLSHLYSLSLVVCCILKGRPFTRVEAMDFRSAHEHHYADKQQQYRECGSSNVGVRDDYNVPSYYTPNVEHLVQSAMLGSVLWPATLQQLPSRMSARELLSTQLRSKSSLAETYFTTLLEVVALLKQCLVFHPIGRQAPGTSTIELIMANLEDLKRIAVLENDDKGCIPASCDIWNSRDYRSRSVPLCGKNSRGDKPLDRLSMASTTERYFRNDFLASLLTVQQYAPSAYASVAETLLAFWKPDNLTTALSSIFQKYVVALDDSTAPFSVLWNALLASWLSGLLRPVEVIHILARQQEVHQYGQDFASLFRQVRSYSRGDIEVQSMFSYDDSVGDESENWSCDEVCVGLSPFETLAIKTLALYVVENTEDDNLDCGICIESRRCSFSALPSPAHQPINAIEVNCQLRPCLFPDAVCCVNTSSVAPMSPEYKAVWLMLDSETSDVQISESANNDSLFLRIGEVLEIPRNAESAFTIAPRVSSVDGLLGISNSLKSSSRMGCDTNPGSFQSLFIEKLIWCSSLQGGQYCDLSNVVPSTTSASGSISTTTHPMILLVRGRWLYDDERSHHSTQHDSTHGRDSDVDTVIFDDVDPESFGQDSESEFSDCHTTPAPLHMPYFLLILDLVSTTLFDGGVSVEESQCVVVNGVYMLKNINHDQTPLCLKLITQPNSGDYLDGLVVYGTGGLLGQISLPHRDSSSFRSSVLIVTHLNCDKYLSAISSDNVPALWSALPREKVDRRSSKTAETICSPHSYDTVITTVCFVHIAQHDSFQCDSDIDCHGLLLSGDSKGNVCLWYVCFSQQHFEINLISEVPLVLDSAIDQLHVAPMISGSTHPFLVVAVSETSCYLLSSNLNLFVHEFSGQPYTRHATLFVKSVLDGVHNNAKLGMGYSLCPRYLVKLESDQLILWRVMRSYDSVSDIVMARRTLKWCHLHGQAPIPLHEKLNNDLQSHGFLRQQRDIYDVIAEQLCHLIVGNEFQSAFDLLQHEGVDAFSPVEVLAWKSILADNMVLPSRTISENSCATVTMLPVNYDAFNAYLSHAVALVAKTRSDVMEGRIVPLFPQERQKNCRPATPGPKVTQAEFRAHHMNKLNHSHERKVIISDDISTSRMIDTISKSSLELHGSRHCENDFHSMVNPVYPLISAATMSNGDCGIGHNILAYVDHYDDNLVTGCGIKSPRVRLFNRASRSYLAELKGSSIVAKLLPLLSLAGEDTCDKISQAHTSAANDSRSVMESVSIIVTAMAFSSSGKTLVVAVHLTPLPTRFGNNAKHVNVRSLIEPVVGIVMWCCTTYTLIGGMLCRPSLFKTSTSSCSAINCHSWNSNDATTDASISESCISTPPRPKAVVTSQPFVGNELRGKLHSSHNEIDSLHFSHQDMLLLVKWTHVDDAEVSSGLYAINWPSGTTNDGRENETQSTPHNELNVSKRYLQSSVEYFDAFWKTSINLCSPFSSPCVPSFSPGRRMAALLLHSVQAWVTTDPTSKVFALQAPQGSGKSDHLRHLVESLKEHFSSRIGAAESADVGFVTCSLPTPPTVVTSFERSQRDQIGQSELNGQLPQYTVSSASFAEIAFDLILFICRELMRSLGTRYIAAVLKGLGTEVATCRSRHMKTTISTSTAAGVEKDTKRRDGSNSFREHRNAHTRQFSETGVTGYSEWNNTGGVQASTPMSSSSPFSSGCPTPPFIFPPFAFASSHPHSKPYECNTSSNQCDDIKEGIHSSEFMNFSELICLTCVGIFLTPTEAEFLHQPTGIVLVPNFELLPFLSLSRLFQVLISDPLREVDINNSCEELRTIIVLDNLDGYDQLHQNNQVQAVVDMLLHCTPSWFRLLLATNSPFNSTTRSYLSSGGTNDCGITDLHVKQFCLRGKGESVSVRGEIVSNFEAGYRLDLQGSVLAWLRTVLLPSNFMSSLDDSFVSDGDDESVNDLSGRVNVVLEQYENHLDEVLSVLLNVIDGSYQCFQLLRSLFTTFLSANAVPLTETMLMQFLSIFDFNSAIMEALYTLTPSHEVELVQKMLEIVAATFEPPPVKALEDMLVAYASSNAVVQAKILSLSMLLNVTTTPSSPSGVSSLSHRLINSCSSAKHKYLHQHLSGSTAIRGGGSTRVSNPFEVDASRGHSLLTWLYLTHVSNKSIAVDHTWQAYLKTYGPPHLHRSSRILKEFTKSIRKIDETCGMKGPLPVQLGYIAGLQEIYARRVGIYGSLPASMGCLEQLRVLSMGNNKISGCIPKTLGDLHHLQRIVLHQNRLSGVVPRVLSHLGCIVNLAGNPLLIHGDDVPCLEKLALQHLFRDTGGSNWISNMGWVDGTVPVSQWYKVGVLGSNVHSIVMSSNNMIGELPNSVSNLQMLRMVELATMPGLRGRIPAALCQLVNLRRLCICRCGLVGEIPPEINQLLQLEELQLFGNSLSGVIPNSLGDLTNLRLLSLGEYTGGNSFVPSVLPSCISRLRKLEALFMANCHLRGPLPNWMGNLSELRQLDLQRNSISGTIPSEFQYLKSLLYLNLKDNNNLSGALPVFPLGRLTKLNRLSLVHCGFESNADRVAELQSLLPRCRLWI